MTLRDFNTAWLTLNILGFFISMSTCNTSAEYVGEGMAITGVLSVLFLVYGFYAFGLRLLQGSSLWLTSLLTFINFCQLVILMVMLG